MMLSDDKTTLLTHILFKGLMDKGLLSPKEEDGKIRRAMRRAIQYELKIGEGMDEAVTRKIQSLSRNVVEGSPEWEVLYRKYYSEEETRRGRG